MSYKYETQWNSPNFTPGADVPRTWGRPFERKAIAIHWWGDPNTYPTYEGVIATLCNPNRGASAHFVATGTGRRVAQLIDFDNASWATNSANPYTISIECDPRCRDEDYDVVAELISQIWDAFGYLPLVPHKQFVATACPGNYDLARLEALAKTKNGSGDWGTVVNKDAPAPEQPKPVDPLYRVIGADGVQKGAYNSDENAYNRYLLEGPKSKVMKNGVDVTQSLIDKFATPPVDPDPEQPTNPETPTEPDNPDVPTNPEEPPKKSTLWEDFLVWFNKYIVAFLSKYKRE